MSYYVAAFLLSASWYFVLWLVAPGFREFPGGVHPIGAALICGGLLAARLSRGFLARTRGALALLAAAMAVALGWICSVTFYAVFFDLARVYYGFQHPSLSTVLWAAMMGAGMSAAMMILGWPVALPALLATVAVTCVVARTLRQRAPSTSAATTSARAT